MVCVTWLAIPFQLHIRTQFCFFQTMHHTFFSLHVLGMSPILPSFFTSVRFDFPHCIKCQVLFVYFLYSVHWCRDHKYFCFPQPLSTFFFQRIMGCHLCYCFSSNVILDVLCSIKFCGFSQHFKNLCPLPFILPSPPPGCRHTHTPFPF